MFVQEDERFKNSMDRWITGNYGQDRFKNQVDEPEEEDDVPISVYEIIGVCENG